MTGSLGAEGSRRSLAISDLPGLPYPYLPYFYYDPDHRQGVTTCSFDLRVDPGVAMTDWRDNQIPFGVGPSFWIKNNRLEVAGRPILALPSGVFVHFQVSAASARIRQEPGTSR